MIVSPACTMASVSAGTDHEPMAKLGTALATPATVASPAAAGPAAAGPMTGARKPKMPANVSAAEAAIDFTIAAKLAMRPVAAPASVALARAATPVVVALVCASSPATHCRVIFSAVSMNLMIRSARMFLTACDHDVVPASRPRNCELKAPSMVENRLSQRWASRSDRLLIEIGEAGVIALVELEHLIGDLLLARKAQTIQLQFAVERIALGRIFVLQGGKRCRAFLAFADFVGFRLFADELELFGESLSGERDIAGKARHRGSELISAERGEGGADLRHRGAHVVGRRFGLRARVGKTVAEALRRRAERDDDVFGHGAPVDCRRKRSLPLVGEGRGGSHCSRRLFSSALI